jgi:carboxymethylenebutenolidase
VTTAFLTENLLIPVPGAPEMAAYLARPADDEPRPAVIVAHELFGVNDDIRGVVDDLARAGYVAVAPEFYHRDAEPGLTLNKDDAGRTRGFELLHALTREDAVADVAATLGVLAARPDVTGSVSMIGFSVGGHLAYLAGTQLDLDSVVVLYAGWLTDTGIPLSRPEPTVTLTKGLGETRLLLLVGDADHVATPEAVEEVRRSLADAGVEHEIVCYSGVGHAYYWPAGATYDADARADSWSRILAFLLGTE